jgi:hypothetical protein
MLRSAYASYQSTMASLARRVTLRHAGRASRPTQLVFALSHIHTHRCLRHLVLRYLAPDPLVDPMRGMPLLARCVAIGCQDPINKRLHRPNRRPLAFDPLAFRRLRARQRLAHHPPMHPSLSATARIVPRPNSYSGRICSNSSTLALRSIPSLPPLGRMLGYSGVGQFTRSKWAELLQYRNHHSAHADFRTPTPSTETG